MPLVAVRSKPTPDQWPERVLLRRVLRRDERGWKELVRRYRSLIYRCISKVTSKHAPYLPNVEVDEIYSDVLVGLLRNDMKKLRCYDPNRGTKLGSWIGTLSVNAAYDYLRAHGREWLQNTSDAPLIFIEDGERTPLDVLLEKERWQYLNQVLRGFSPRDRRFLELYYDRGMTPEAIAEAMAISLKTVYTKKHKIRARLHRSLERGRQKHALADLVR